MFENEEKKERAVLVAVDTKSYDVLSSLAELEELAETAGAEVVATVVQNMPNINNATYIGSGKLQEVKDLAATQEIDLLIFDDELSGSQIKNIEDEINAKVIDRTMLILDIFALRALSTEGKLQVELAQQKYLLPRLLGMGKQLSRQQGGIGSRGPGESKLESDRRHIRRRIEALESELRELEKRRDNIRRRRKKNDVPVVAIVGYTNVGKSTLLNLLTNAGVLAKDQLFATLDPTARELKLPDGQKAIMVDTVGLLRRLPHQLINAFKSTLEEAANADLILNICDISNENVRTQLEVTKELLGELGCGDIPTITVYNKIDKVSDSLVMNKKDDCCYISAKDNLGVDNLLKMTAKALSASMKRVKLLIPYNVGHIADRVRRGGKILAESYEENGIYLEANVELKLMGVIGEYVIE